MQVHRDSGVDESPDRQPVIAAGAAVDLLAARDPRIASLPGPPCMPIAAVDRTAELARKQWREHVEERHIHAFKRGTGDLLVRMGYELNDEW